MSNVWALGKGYYTKGHHKVYYKGSKRDAVNETVKGTTGGLGFRASVQGCMVSSLRMASTQKLSSQGIGFSRFRVGV